VIDVFRVNASGATNRPDAVDPALRRPGRFDRELAFTLPDKPARRQILDIHTAKWNPPLAVPFKNEIAERTVGGPVASLDFRLASATLMMLMLVGQVGYCGADIKALCTEAAMRALRRRYPQIYHSTQKLVIKQKEVMVLRQDFANAMKAISPAAHRCAGRHAPSRVRVCGAHHASCLLHRTALSYAAALPSFAQPLLREKVDHMSRMIHDQGIPGSQDGKGNDSDLDDVFEVRQRHRVGGERC
jgi:hypothetical protein